MRLADQHEQFLLDGYDNEREFPGLDEAEIKVEKRE
jgi:hypothetical protein